MLHFICCVYFVDLVRYIYTLIIHVLPLLYNIIQTMKQLVPKAVDMETVRLQSPYIYVSSELLEFTKNALFSEDSDEK